MQAGRALLSVLFGLCVAPLLLSCESPSLPPPVIAKFSDVSGLKPNAPVWLRGVEVGRVERVALTQDDYVEVEFRLYASAASTHIAQNDCATIEARGLAGDKLLRLRPASMAEELLPGGSGTCFGRDEGGQPGTQISAILQEVLEGKGILGRLLTDRELANKFEKSLECKP